MYFLSFRPQAYRVNFSGIGIHSGSKSSVGIVSASNRQTLHDQTYFVNEHTNWIIPCSASSVKSTVFCTELGHKDSSDRWTENNVRTVEHMLAAWSVIGMRNITVIVRGTELPIFDGSASFWVEELFRQEEDYFRGFDQESIITSYRTRKAEMVLVVRKPVRVRSGDAWCELLPPKHDELKFDLEYTLDYPHPLIGKQTVQHSFVECSGLKESDRRLLAARTFGFEHQAVELKLRGLAQGASLENTLVFSETGILNPEGQRFEHEPAYHKLLDVVGDLALAEYRIVGEFRGYKSGHALNVELVRELYRDPENFQLVKL